MQGGAVSCLGVKNTRCLLKEGRTIKVEIMVVCVSLKWETFPITSQSRNSSYESARKKKNKAQTRVSSARAMVTTIGAIFSIGAILSPLWWWEMVVSG
jgi:hypothetical protein